MFSTGPADEPVAATHLATLETTPHTYHAVTTRAELDALVERLLAAERFAFDTETTGLDARNVDLIGCSFALEAGEAWWVPVASEAWNREEYLDALRPVFAAEDKEAIAHNYKYDYQVLRSHGVQLKNRIFDTMIAHYLLQPESGHGLDRLAELDLGYQTIPLSQLIGEKGKGQKSPADVPADQWTDYACEDADVALRLAERYRPQLEEVAATALARDVEFPLTRVLAEVEREGVHIDRAGLAQYSEELATQIEALDADIQRLAERPFNVDSPKQLGPILFEHLGIKAKVKRTKSGQYPTGEEVLIKLEQQHPIIPLILEYRKLKKLRSTYVEPLPKLIDPGTGRVYMQAVAATGRLSSNHPNLQNIPIRTAEGRAIRKAFIPRDADHVLVAADYSQVELRIAAAMSGDPGLCEAFREGHDIHTATAARVFGVAYGDVDRTMRSKAKAVNFGILYGQGAFGLAQNLNISRSEAKEIIDAYFAQFRDLKDFTQQCVDRARETGYAETLMGRRRYLPDITSANTNVRAFAERNAVNAPIQGSAADIIKVAMLRIQAAIEREGWATRMIMQVHDELVFDVPQSELDAVIPVIQREMEGAATLSVPLVVEVNTGKDWLEAH
jgi:DNA polymerase-1